MTLDHIFIFVSSKEEADAKVTMSLTRLEFSNKLSKINPNSIVGFHKEEKSVLHLLVECRK